MLKTLPHCRRLTTIALVGNYIPRQCGIAVFTADLLTALNREQSDLAIWAAAMNDQEEGYDYPEQVRYEINQRFIADYRLAADFINMNKADVVCLQHEFGIFGGSDGSYVIELLEHIQAPRITTFHTVLHSPSSGQMNITRKIAQLSDSLVVMSNKAKDILQQVYGIPAEKINIIPHGIPDVPFADPYYYKDYFGLSTRKVLLTFGLLSPNKGIEFMIEAMPRIIQEHPDVTYIILGASHPHEKKYRGDSYRLSLQRRARDLGVDSNILFYNRFVSLQELKKFLGAADIYITPYLNQEQITSGTLAYALGAGKAVVSTPYWHAEELLADGRGTLIPFRDAPALAEAVNHLLSNESLRQTMRKQAYTYGRTMVWKEVARCYLTLFERSTFHQDYHLKSKELRRLPASLQLEFPQPKLDHIINLTDDTGILQHAKYCIPKRSHGYCTDDNARALLCMAMYREMFSDSREVQKLTYTYLSFLQDAFCNQVGRFRNFLQYDRKWLDEIGSEDCHGRSVWALGEVSQGIDDDDIRDISITLFQQALPAMHHFNSPRAWAFALVGLHAYLKRFQGDSEARRTREVLAEKLLTLYNEHSSDTWPWIEDMLSYANGKIPQALIISGHDMQREEMLQAGLRLLTWLIHIQFDPQGHFAPIGNAGWYPRGGEKARFDQQPIEAFHMIQACHAAYQVTLEKAWIDHARRCMDWFLGKNDLKLPLYCNTTGGCCDGLQPDRVNRNQGAESTLAGLMSLLNIHQLRGHQISSEVSAAEEDTNSVNL